MTPELKTHIYLAGLFDGEGSFTIQVRIREHKGVKRIAFTPRMTMGLYYGFEALDLLRYAFGGAIYKYSDGGRRWSIGSRRGVTYAAELLQPHLVIKRKICERYLQALAMFPPIRRNQWQGNRTWSKEAILEVAQIAYTLNPISPIKTEKNRQSLEQIRRICADGWCP